MGQGDNSDAPLGKPYGALRCQDRMSAIAMARRARSLRLAAEGVFSLSSRSSARPGPTVVAKGIPQPCERWLSARQTGRKPTRVRTSMPTCGAPHGHVATAPRFLGPSRVARGFRAPLHQNHRIKTDQALAMTFVRCWRLPSNTCYNVSGNGGGVATHLDEYTRLVLVSVAVGHLPTPRLTVSG